MLARGHRLTDLRAHGVARQHCERLYDLRSCLARERQASRVLVRQAPAASGISAQPAITAAATAADMVELTGSGRAPDSSPAGISRSNPAVSTPSRRTPSLGTASASGVTANCQASRIPTVVDRD